MRALAFRSRSDKLAVQDIPATDPGPGQVQVAVEAASINGIDAAAAAGYLWDMLPAAFPVVLGRDMGGSVAAAGEGVTGFAPGDRVAGVITGMTLAAGTVAGLVTVDAGILTAQPAGVSSVQAAGAGLAAVTAHDLTAALALTEADVVLVSGATGGVGAYAVQMASAGGARVLATARPGDASDFVRGLGADAAIDYTGDLTAAVRAAAPEGVTAVVHAAGDVAALAALLSPDGHLVSALGATAEQAGREDITVTGVMAVAEPEKFAALLASVAAGTLRVPVARTYPLDQATQALADFSGHKLGKLVITVP
jgi:NADPH:quinone reductase-like Zn-dependent oxidoreductase